MKLKKKKEEQTRKRKEYLHCSPPRTRKRQLVAVQFGETVGNNTQLANIGILNEEMSEGNDDAIIEDNEESVHKNNVNNSWSDNIPESFSNLPCFKNPSLGKLKHTFNQFSAPGEYFCNFFSPIFLIIIVNETNLYASQKNIPNWKNTNAEEIKAFIAAIMYMGIHVLPGTSDYWSSFPELRVFL